MAGYTAIAVESISKTYQLAHDPAGSFKERILRLNRKGFDEFHALTDVSLEIESGTTVGILGHNGSGKSTLLKCIAGIVRPTVGQIKVRGRLASLLELGAGFHPELSGRENVFLNASFLGISRREIGARFDDIVAFAEIPQFIDEPVKHYSSGMYVRLAFAVAVNLDPDVLLVDEVLAVGDETFQKKCLDRVRSLQEAGKTIVVVTHNADSVRQVCDRGIVLHRGKVVADGPPGEAIRTYREHLHGKLKESAAVDDTSPVRITSVEITHAGLPERKHLLRGESLQAVVDYEVDGTVDDPVLWFEITDTSGRVLFSIDSDRLGHKLAPLSGAGQLLIETGPLHLLDHDYRVNVRIADHSHDRALAMSDQKYSFAVLNRSRATGLLALDVSMSHVQLEHLR